MIHAVEMGTELLQDYWGVKWDYVGDRVWQSVLGWVDGIPMHRRTLHFLPTWVVANTNCFKQMIPAGLGGGTIQKIKIEAKKASFLKLRP